MAFDPRNVKYPPPDAHHPQNMTAYPYHNHHHNHHHAIQSMHRMDENRNENQCGNKEMCSHSSHQSSGTQTIQKVDAATMTDPLQIDFRLTSEYLERCSTSLGRLPYLCKYEDNSNNCQDVHSKVDYEIPDRPHVCEICGASLKRKEHLDRHMHGHSKERPYKCTICMKAFKRKEHLNRHLVTHGSQKTEICQICSKAFHRRDHLKKHILSHSNGGSAGKSKSPTGLQPSQASTFAMMMRQAGPPPFLRT